ncbi:MAG TPA: carboxypeptidase regulatory-like domain-containing protein [Albitalea sp.]
MTTRWQSIGRNTARGVAAAAVLACGAAWAAQEGVTPAGVRYLSGGVSEEEAAVLQSRRGEYTLWVVAAARGSGAYLADVAVRIVDAKGSTVFEGVTDGPWLMVDLPLGRYVVEARLGDETLRRTTTIHAGDHHQAVFHFDVDVDVRPAAERRLRSE